MFACVFIPDFSVEAVLRVEPMLRGQAIAVLDGVPPLCYVVGVNEKARKMGVQIGMTKMQVDPNGKTEKRKNGKTERTNRQHGERGTKFLPLNTSIAEQVQQRTQEVGYWHGSMYRASAGETLVTPWQSQFKKHEGPATLILRQRSAGQEATAHDALLDAAQAVSPRVEDTAVDTVVLNVAGLDRLFGTLGQIAQELSNRLTEVGLQGNVAIAANANAAEHAARGWNGMTLVAAGRELERLGSLPLEVLFQAELNALSQRERQRDQRRKIADRLTRIQQTLDRWGIRNFSGLASLPPISLSERLGADGVRLQSLAAGVATRELVLTEPVLRFEETIELEYPVEVLEPLAFLLARMLEGLCGRLNARALSTNELRLRMRLEHRTGDETAKSESELDGEAIAERKITLPVPMNDPKLFLKLLQLELSASPPGAPVTQLWLTAEPARPQVGQAGLFMPLAPEAQKLELTLARIHKLLGVREVLRAGSAEVLDTHEPDAFRVVRFTPNIEERESGKTAKRQNEKPIEELEGDASADLVLRRCRPPLVAHVELRDGLPMRVVCAQLGVVKVLHDNIVWSAGPWRTSGKWWEGKSENSKTEEQQPEQLKCAWDREEWDIALAVTTRGAKRRERETEIGLYRLVRNCADEQWSIEGSYD